MRSIISYIKILLFVWHRHSMAQKKSNRMTNLRRVFSDPHYFTPSRPYMDTTWILLSHPEHLHLLLPRQISLFLQRLLLTSPTQLGIRDWWLYGYLSLQVQSSPARFYWPIEGWIPRVPEGSILPLPESDSISRTVVRRWDRTAGGLNSGFRLPVGWRFSRIIFKVMRTERS